GWRATAASGTRASTGSTPISPTCRRETPMDTITDAPRTGHALYLERLLAAPRELVFQAWVDPVHIRRWSAPHGYEIPEAGGEARPGGSRHSTMRSPEGRLLRLVGTYREVVP